ncbi:transposase [Halobacteriovorax sp. GFR7]|uniref:transposase n=1 Tax=unclassified Halobacteriovorax TaxID=2639665 RepID=UPI003D98A9E8
MPRKKLIRSSEHVYHITTRSNSKEWFYLPLHECWNICVELISEGLERFSVELHAFVLMNNHYHLMARFPKANIDKFMHFYNKNMSRRINMSTGRINHVFGGTYKWSLINSERYYFNAIKYLYQNPVRANICSRVEDYPYSTLHEKRYKIKTSSYLTSIDLHWMNELYSKESVDRIRKGFKRTHFRPSYDKKRGHSELL